MIGGTRICVLALCLIPVAAAAQAPKESFKGTSKAPANSQPPAVPATPERTTASFGDWVMRCEGGAAAAQRRICEVAQVITVQGQTNPVAQVALGRSAPNEGKRLTVVLPPNIAIMAKLQVSVAKAGVAPLELTWQRCTPGGCFASAPITEEAIGTFATQTEAGKIAFKDASDRDAVLPLSFRGLSQAIAALAKEQ